MSRVVARKMAEEQWKPVVEYEGYYEVSNRGDVRSVTRKVAGRNGRIDTRLGQAKKTFVSKNGRQIVNFSKEGINKTYQVSRLMALAFLPNPGDFPEVDHIDRNPLNNDLANLRWCNRQTNLDNRTPFQQPLGVTGERYIIITAQGNYQIRIRGLCLGTHSTLEEAKVLRDDFIASHPEL